MLKGAFQSQKDKKWFYKSNKKANSTKKSFKCN